MGVAWAVARPGAPAFWPWLQVLRALPADLVGAHPRVRRLFDATEAGAADLRTRFELFEDMAALLADATSAGALLVVVDDLHEADTASLLLLQHLAAVVPSMPLLVVATVRTDVEPERTEWADVWPNLVRHGEVVAVGPLREEQIAGLLADAIGDSEPPLVQRIARRTGGNALFVCELIRFCAAADGDVDALPDTVRALIATRVAERSALCRRALSLVAVTGTTARLALVVDVLGEGRDDVLGGLDEAQRHGLLDRPDPDRLAFVHEIVRDAIYNGLPAAHRAHWHRAVADWLAGNGVAADAAYHYRLAGPELRSAAAQWFVRAGDESLAMLAYEDAADQFRAALDSDPPEPGPVQLRLGTALLAAGDMAGARAAHLAAAAAARRTSDADLLAAAALGLGAGPGGFEIPLFDREQIAALEDALEMLGERAPAVRAAVLGRLSVALTFTAEPRRADLAAAAVQLARSAGDDASLAVALASQVDVLAGPQHVEQRLAMTTEIVNIAQRLRDSSLELLGLRQRIVTRFELGDMPGLGADIREFRTVAAALRQPLYTWYVPLWNAGLALARGELAEAAQQLEEAERIGTQAGSVNAEMLVTGHRFVRAGELADRDAMREVFATGPLDESLGPWAPITASLVHASLGEISLARARLDAATDRLVELPRDSEWLPTLTQAAEAVLIVGGHPVTGWLYDALLPYAGLFVVEGIGAAPRGSVQRHLGMLAALLGDRAAAEEHFARALEANRRIGARLYVARTLHDAAASLNDSDRLAEARALYAEIGISGPLDPAGVAATADGNIFRRDGDVWTLEYAGRRITLRDSKGLRDLSILLANPGHTVPAVELATARDAAPVPRRGDTADLHEPGDLGEVLDAQARRAYTERLRELEAEAAEADAAADIERSARIAAERDALLAELGTAYGLSGRPRRAGSAVERARTTVTARIRDSIRRIDAAHPPLGRHLSAAIRTGTLCSYEPEHPVTWLLTP